MRDYLSKIALGELTSEGISAAEAKAELEKQLALLCSESSCGMAPGTDFGKFPCKGLDLPDTYNYVDLSECVGLTPAQLAGSYMAYSQFPELTFTGTENMTGTTCIGMDLTKWGGLTGTQVTQMTLSNVQLAVDFKPTDSFSGSLESVDFSKCTGVNAALFSGLSSYTHLYFTNEQYEAVKDTLLSIDQFGYIYADGQLKNSP